MWDDTAVRRPAIRPSPVFLLFVALAVAGGWLAWTDASDSTGTSSARIADVGVFLLVVGAWVVTLSLHEFGHAYAAYRAGDRSVEAAGYLTLNPFRYAHPLLSIVLPLLFILRGGFGLPGGAVYLHPHRFRSRVSQSLTALAGPAVNVVFAVALLAAVRVWGFHPTVSDGIVFATRHAHLRFWSGLAFLGFLQVSAAVLNLLPIPGLDGYAVVEPWLSAETQRSFAPVKQWGMIGVIVLLQFAPLAQRFFDVIYWVYDLSGAPQILSQLGDEFLRFWQG